MGKLRDTVACNYDNFSAQLSRVDYSLQLGQVSQGRRRKFRIPRITLTFRYESSWKILIKRLKKILLRYLEDFDRIYFYLSSICCSIIAFIFYNNFKLVEIQLVIFLFFNNLFQKYFFFFFTHIISCHKFPNLLKNVRYFSHIFLNKFFPITWINKNFSYFYWIGDSQFIDHLFF